MFKVFLYFVLLNSYNVFSKEYNQEVTVQSESSSTITEQKFELKQKGMEETIHQKLNSDGYNLENFKSKVKARNFSSINYSSFLESFFDSTELIMFAGLNGKMDINGKQIGVLKSEISDLKFKERLLDFIEDLEQYKKKSFYFSLIIDLSGTTKWEDLGVYSEESFTPIIIKSWNEYLNLNTKNFSSVVLVDDTVKSALDTYSKIVNENSVELRYTFFVNKLAVDDNSKKITVEISAHYVLVNAKNHNIIQSYEIPIQKKIFSNKVKSEYSSSIASFIYNLGKSNFTKILAAIDSNKISTDQAFDLKNVEFFSDIYKAQLVLNNYLSVLKLKVTIKRLGLTNAQLAITEVSSLDKLKAHILKMDKLPLSSDVSEKKVLIFDAVNNSFAITKKD